MLKMTIEKKLREAFSPTYLEIKDESHLHTSHGNYKPGGESHLSITLVSSLFCGLTRIERHQKVYACLDEELKNGVHALRLKTLCPEETNLTSSIS